MKLYSGVLAGAVLTIVLLISCNNEKKTKMDFELKYPETKKDEVKDTYFGTEVSDPFRWLEDDNSQETADWVKKQNEITFKYFDNIPYREKIKNRLLKIWDYPKMSAPVHQSGKYFYYRNDGLQNQSVLYYKNGIKGKEVELLNPNVFDKDGSVSLSTIAVSEDGNYLGYAISRAGSDWQEIFIRDIETTQDLKDHLKWVKFSSIAWHGDGFYYSCYPEPVKGQELSGVNTNSKIYFHKIGTNQSQDQLIYEDPANPEMGFSADVTEGANYLLIYASVSTSGNALYYKNLKKPNSPVLKLVDGFDNDFSVVDEINNNLYIHTNYGAPKYKLIEVNLLRPAKKYWKDVIPQEDGVLQSVSLIGKKFIANYMIDAHSVVKIFDDKGKYLHILDSKVIGTISGFSGERDDYTTFYTVTSFTAPATVYMYNIKNNKSTLYEKSKVDFKSDEYITKQVFYSSKVALRCQCLLFIKTVLHLMVKTQLFCMAMEDSIFR